jgi:tRNA (cmo5U34)-methyltransferase
MTAWSFTDFGPEFDTHVAAHLPGYADVQRLVGMVAEFAVPVGGTVADLGCSTGRTAATLYRLERQITMHLYDADATMLDEARTRGLGAAVHYHQATLPDGMTHHDADLTVCLWLLQFLNPDQWRTVLHAARVRSRSTGALIVAAKTRHPDPRWEEIAVAALDEYKNEAGVSLTERAHKTKALRGVLYQASVDHLCTDITAAGWHNPTVLWRWHVWSVLGAWASPV